MSDFQKRISEFKCLFNEAKYVLIGAGAGLSTAVGFEYSGEFFHKYFADFIAKYHFTDMYSAGFYPFETEEEKWAYWSRYVYVNRYKAKANPLYTKLHDFVKHKDYFVLTTNVDHQFQLAGFDKSRLFYMQGDYGLLQCSVPCHNKTYDNEQLILKMVREQKDYRVPTQLIPKCPVCGRNMEMNLRADDRFVQDDGWYQHAELYQEFLEKTKGPKLLLIEIGIGFNTPAIIRYPFEKMTYLSKDTHLVRINKDYPIYPQELVGKAISFDEDIDIILDEIIK